MRKGEVKVRECSVRHTLAFTLTHSRTHTRTHARARTKAHTHILAPTHPHTHTHVQDCVRPMMVQFFMTTAVLNLSVTATQLSMKVEFWIVTKRVRWRKMLRERGRGRERWRELVREIKEG